MELAAILRELWRWRILVAGGAALAALAAVTVMYSVTLSPPGLKSRSYDVGAASARALIDTPSSKVVDLGSGQTNTPANVDIGALGTRAKLLVNLMAGDALRAAIAKRLGIRSDELIAFAPSVGGPRDARTTAPAPSAENTGLHMLSLEADGELPIISIDARAPSPAEAEALANAAVPALREHLERVARDQHVPTAQQLVVQQLDPALGQPLNGGPNRLTAVVVFLFVLGLACVVILVVSSVSRGWRQVVAAELAVYEQWWPDRGSDPEDLVGPERENGSAAAGDTEREYAR
jgi:hypothetical protein